jgi:DNA topoisomerase-1
VRPEDITINIGQEAPIPIPNTPGQWKSIIHDSTVTWLANWIENVNGNHKYVFLAAGSTLKGQSDMQKFEKSRELKVSACLCLAKCMISYSVGSRRSHTTELYP